MKKNYKESDTSKEALARLAFEEAVEDWEKQKELTESERIGLAEAHLALAAAEV